MAKKKTKPEEIKYLVLIDCHNNDTGGNYVPGDTVTDEDFPREVINNWLIIDPPVLEVVKDGSTE